jgi:2-amino-4-hydroxy-6-hydroxymethyldihydropteridine diphosphokinase
VGDLVLPAHGEYLKWAELPASDQAIRAPEHLILPHPRMQDRPFVLVPLADVAPDWRHPVLGQTVRDMLESLPKADCNTIVPLDRANFTG